MSNEKTLIFVICLGGAIILLYKAFMIFKRIKNMQLIDGTCTDVTIKPTYQKNIRMYYYEYKYKKEEYTIADKTRFLIPGFNPKIKDTVKIYINPKKPEDSITPLEIYRFKMYLILGIILIILPFLIL